MYCTKTQVQVALWSESRHAVPDRLLLFSWQAGAASAATAAQYTGAAVMLFMMARKDLLKPADMGSLPPLKQWADTLKPGVPFAFCIAAVVTALLTATNLATGARRSL